MGSLDQGQAAQVNRKINLVDVTAYSPAQIVDHYNNNYGNKGWEIKQVVIIGSSKFILVEKQY